MESIRKGLGCDNVGCTRLFYAGTAIALTIGETRPDGRQSKLPGDGKEWLTSDTGLSAH